MRIVLVATTRTARKGVACKISPKRAKQASAVCIACGVRLPSLSRPAPRRIGSRAVFNMRIP